MANAPITIGPFTNVPAPGSPVASDWPQQITQYVVDHATQIPTIDRVAGVSNSLVLSGTYATFTTVTFPSATHARVATITGGALANYQVAGVNEQVDMRMLLDGVDQGVFYRGIPHVYMIWPLWRIDFNIAAGQTRTAVLQMKEVGTATGRNVVDSWSRGIAHPLYVGKA